MALKLICNKCKKVHLYTSYVKKCCKKETSEIYECDKCGILMNEDEYIPYEIDIECYEYCSDCYKLI